MAQAPAKAPATAAPPAVTTVPGMPPVADAANLYSETTAAKLSPAVAGDLPRVYVPHVQSNDVYVIDPATFTVIDKFKVGLNPQHVVPSWDLRTLWVANNAENTNKGSLIPIDPKTGKPGKAIAVDDPYNMYFSPDGKSAIVVAEAMKRLDFRDPKTMQLQYSIDVPRCAGHQSRRLLDRRHVRDLHVRVRGHRRQDRPRQPQGAGLHAGDPARAADKIVKGPDGRDEIDLHDVEGHAAGHPRVARRQAVLRRRHDGRRRARRRRWRRSGRSASSRPARARTASIPSRDGTKLYVANRGSNKIHGPPKGKGGVSVIDFATQKVEANWPIPGGGSPDMGNVSADGKWLWLSGRYDNVVYAFDTGTGEVKIIPVGKEPHGLTVWPQPGRYSLGHTGNLR